MADHAIVVMVTPTGSTPPFIFTYSDNGGTPSTNGTVTVPAATSKTFLVSIMADGQPGDTCVFPAAPLLFTDRQGNELPDPEWFQDFDPIDSSTISFTDNNTNLDTRDYIVFIKAIYNGTPITSPDPTIVNDGIDHSSVEMPSQDRPKPLVSVV